MTTLLDCGTDWFQMGTSGSFLAERTGRLKMRCNEYLGGLGDNEPPPAAKLWTVSIGGESYDLDSLSETNGPLVVQGQTYFYTASGVVWAGNYDSEECLWDPDGVRSTGGCAPSTPTIAPEGWVAPGLVEVSLVGRIVYSGTVTLSVASPNVFVNADDDNQNGASDVNEGNQAVSNENDLVAVSLSQTGLPSDGMITLSLTPDGSGGHARVWTNQFRHAGGPLIDHVGSVSWIVSNLPSTVYLEGAGASTQVNDLSLILSATPCQVNTATAQVTVVDVTSVTWASNSISPLISNAELGGAGGGVAIFPDRPSPMSSPDDYNTVEVKAVIQPPMADIPIYFASLDADDPSANTAPVDDENSTQDNRGTPKTGNFVAGGDSSTIAWPTEPGGTSTVTFITTMQPGDNFRVIASPLADFKNGYEAKQDANDGAVVRKFGEHSPISNKYTTEMLTVWRHLWIEQDYMRQIPSAARQEKCAHVRRSGLIGTGSFVISSNEFTAGAINYGPQYGVNEPAQDEFEGGPLTFKLFNSNQNLLATYDTGHDGKKFIVLKSPKAFSWTKKFYFWGKLTPEQLNRMKANDVSSIHAYFNDDDDYTLFDQQPKLLDVGDVGRQAYAVAYIMITNAPAAWNTRPSLDWVRHLSVWQFAFTLGFMRNLPNTADFWSALVVACNEPSRNLGGDGDPDGMIDLVPPYYPFPGSGTQESDAGALYGASGGIIFNPGRNLSVIVLQVIHDYETPFEFVYPRNIDEEHTTTHEIAHTAGESIDHYDAMPNLMHSNPKTIQQSTSFAPKVLDDLRSVPVW
jgi:hypothetical protein